MASINPLKALLPAFIVASTIGLGASAKHETTLTDAINAGVQRQSSAETIKANKVDQNMANSSVKTDAATKDLGGTASTPKNDHSVPVKQVTAKQAQMNQETAKAVNKVPGVHLKSTDLQPPADDPPIKGFHPIKRALQPIIRLEKNSVDLEQQIMKLEGPIGALQPAMLGLHNKMDGVSKRMGSMQGQLGQMSSQVSKVGDGMNKVGEHMSDVSTDMKLVRQDIAGMRKQIGQLEIPIRQLQKPLNDLQRPLNSVAKPLQDLQQEIKDLKGLLATILFTIVIAAIAVAIGTPIAAILIYKNRHKIFPDMRDHDFPGAKEPLTAGVSSRPQQ